MKNFIPSLLLGCTFLLCASNVTALAERTGAPPDDCRRNCATTPSGTSHLSDADRTKLAALAEERKCLIRLAQPFADYTQLFSTWLTNDTSKYFLLTNFRDFQVRNDRKFAEIKKFASPALPTQYGQ